MAPDERVEFFEAVLDRFLSRAQHDDWVVFEVVGSPDDYIRIAVGRGSIRAEVGAHEQPSTAPPLGPFAAGFLEMNEFARETTYGDFQRDHLPRESWTLARLMDRLFEIYELPSDFDVLVRGKPPRFGRAEAVGEGACYTPPRYDTAPAEQDDWDRSRRRRRRRGYPPRR